LGRNLPGNYGRMKDFIKKAYQKNGKKAVAIFLVYFVTKWTLTIVFGAKIVAAFKGWIN
jgi:hypothetical protein